MDQAEVQRIRAQLREIHGPIKKHKPQTVGFVYFVQEEDDGPIKIGWAADPLRRLASMQSGNPRRLTLLGTLATRRRVLERELHERFAAHRLTGEWFEPNEEILAFIESPERHDR